MKILIIHKANPSMAGILLFNLVYGNLADILKPESIELELLFIGPAQKENVFFNPIAFTKIQQKKSIFYFLKTRKFYSYDILINLSFDYVSLMYYLAIKSAKKTRIKRGIYKRLAKLSLVDREKILAEKIIQDLIPNDFVFAELTPKLNLPLDKLLKTSQLSNWVLECANQKPLNGLNYVYLQFRIDETSLIDDIIAFLDDILTVKRVKIVIVFENDNLRDQMRSRLIAFNESHNKSILILDFLSFKDFCFWFLLAEKAQCIVTNNSLLSLVCAAKNWYYISSQKETLTKIDIHDLGKRLRYFLNNNKVSSEGV